MTRSLNILKLVFVFLILIILIEIGYLYFTTKDLSFKKESKNISYEKIFDQYINPYIKKRGILADNNLLKKFIVTEEYEGIIEEIKFENGIDKDIKFKYNLILKISLINKSGKKISDDIRLLNDRDLKIIKVYEITSTNQKKEITINKLKKGDHIIINFTSDYLAHPDINLINGFIIKK